MPIYSKYTGVGGGTIYTFVGVAPITVTDVLGTVTTSMSQSGALSDGWLSSIDWNTFNSKQNALTFGNLTETVSSVLTITGGTGAVIGSGTTIQMSQAGAGTSGYLSSTDWNTFNNKQPAGSYITALTGEVTATGPGSATATISNQSGNTDKVLATNGTAVTWQYSGLGSGTYPLNSVILGKGLPAGLVGTNNIVLGTGTTGDGLIGQSSAILIGNNSTGTTQDINQIRIGHNAAGSFGQNVLVGNNATCGGQSVSIGNNSFSNNFCTVVGHNATSVGDNATIVGWNASSATNSTSVGSEASRYCTGGSNVAVGANALKGASGLSPGDLNCAVGFSAGLAIRAGFANTLIGYNAGNTITDGIGNTLVGYNCQAASATTNNAFVLGSGSTAGNASIAMGSSVTGGASCVTIGQLSTSSGSTGSIVLGHSSSAVNTNNVFSVGSTVQNILTTYLGLGAEQILAAGDFKAIKLMTARAGSGGALVDINASAGTLTLAGSQGSGTGVGGSVYIATAPAGLAGNTLNAHVNRVEVTTTGETRLLGSTSGYVGLSSPAAPTSYSLVLPSSQGVVDTVLANDGSGNLTWQYAGLGAGALGTNNVVVGRSKPSFTSAANVTLVGATSGNAITSGTQHTCLGSGSGGAALIAGTNSTAVGYNALVTGATPSNAVAIGANSSAGGDATFGGTAIGANSIADNQSVAVGKSAVAQNARNVSIGRGTNTGSASDGICIGSNITLSNSGILIAAAGAAQTQSVANSIGLYAACQVANSILLGQSRNIYFNNHGVQRAAVPALSENQIFTNSYSTGGATNNGDASGGILSINGAQGTGTGIGGDIRFRTSPPGAVSNNVQNALVEQVRITYDGKLGVGTNAPAVLVHAQQTTSATNTVTNILRVDSQSSGTPATGIGVGIQMAAETSVGNTEIGVVLEAVTTDVTAASEDFDLVVKNMAAGAAATETLRITSTGDTKVVQGQLSVETAGKGLSVKEGSNAKIGVTTAFPGGGTNTVTVSTTAVTANSIIFISAVSGATTIDPKIWVSTITAGTSFVISSGDNSFTGTVGWMIVERIP